MRYHIGTERESSGMKCSTGSNTQGNTGDRPKRKRVTMSEFFAAIPGEWTEHRAADGRRYRKFSPASESRPPRTRPSSVPVSRGNHSRQHGTASTRTRGSRRSTVSSGGGGGSGDSDPSDPDPEGHRSGRSSDRHGSQVAARHCWGCGEVIDPARRSDAKFCPGSKCRMRFERSGQQAQPLVEPAVAPRPFRRVLITDIDWSDPALIELMEGESAFLMTHDGDGLPTGYCASKRRAVAA